MKIRTTCILSAGAIALGAAMPANAQFDNRLVDEDTAVNTIDDINEAEAILAAPGTRPVTTNQSATIDFPSNAPAGFTGEDFATESIGVVDVIDGTTGSFNLVVKGDDGFRLRVNETVISEYVGPTGSSNVGVANFTLNDGDLIRLTFFERGGGENNVFQVDADGVFGAPNSDPGAAGNDRVLVGLADSGILINPIPEPATLSLLGLGGLGLLARRRRA